MLALGHPVYSESGHDRYLQGIDMTTRESGKKTETESVGRKSTLWESLTDDANKEKFVLVIEDSCDHAQSLLILLRMEGYRVECEADGRSGWNRVQAALPDLLMLDVMMPGLNGADVGKAIRSSKATNIFRS
jgi:PleD family two-component response regulator